jgi:membrane protein implicated in regulation of membrane protease activity
VLTFFWVCFGVGVGYTVIAFLLGQFSHFGFGGDAEGVDGIDGIDGVDGIDGIDGIDGVDGVDGVDGGIDGGADGNMGGAVSPLKPSVIAAFITIFGATGLLLNGRLTLIFLLPTAVFTGLVVAFCMYRFIIVPLYNAQNTSTVDIQYFVGMKARVTEKIIQGGYGQITYQANGNTFTSPARAEDGGAIDRHSTVEIIYIKDNTYYVKGGV